MRMSMLGMFIQKMSKFVSYLFKCYLFRVDAAFGSRATHARFLSPFPLVATSSRCVYGEMNVAKTKNEAATKTEFLLLLRTHAHSERSSVIVKVKHIKCLNS